MPIIIQGNGGTSADVGVTHRALRVEARPLDHGSFGAFAWGGFTGILPAALGANSEVFQFRWSDGSRLALIRRVRVSASVSTTMFAAGVPVQIDLVRATSWTVAGSGGTRVTPAALMKKRSSMASSLVAASDIGIATTAALTAGTKTLDTYPLRALAAAGPITGSLSGQIIMPDTNLFDAALGDGDHPLVLAANEGFVIRSVAVPATGTWSIGVDVDWVEVSAY